jgi:hypothetical protein
MPTAPNWMFPPQLEAGIELPTYAWAAYTSVNQRITSAQHGSNLSAIPNRIVLFVRYHSDIPGRTEPRTFQYVDPVTGKFLLPDGTTRDLATGMNEQAYANLANNIWTNDVYPS